MSDTAKGFLFGLTIALMIAGLWYATTHKIVVFSFGSVI